jgi:predicted SnoaL-like aldol condensation-catalyzing enzyme
VHLDITFIGKRFVVIDLFRLENGQLAEHWDGGQAITAQEDGPITMTNGCAIIDETVDGNANKRLVKEFYREVFEDGNPDVVGKYLKPDYVEHNPFSSFLNRPGYKTKVHRIIAEGDFVVSQCEYLGIDNTFARYSIFRIADNRIVEHWSVEQEVPVSMAHNNGMF